MLGKIRRLVRTIVHFRRTPKKEVREGKFPFSLTVSMSAEMKRYCRKMSDLYGSMSNFVRLLISNHMTGAGREGHVPTKKLTIERYTLEEPVLPNKETTPEENPSPPVTDSYGEDHGPLMDELRRVLKDRNID